MSILDLNKKLENKDFISKFCKLIGFLENHNKKVLDDPLKYIKLAHDDIIKNREVVRKLNEAAFLQPKCLEMKSGHELSPHYFDTFTVTKEDYDCLCAVREILSNPR